MQQFDRFFHSVMQENDEFGEISLNKTNTSKIHYCLLKLLHITHSENAITGLMDGTIHRKLSLNFQKKSLGSFSVMSVTLYSMLNYLELMSLLN